MSWVEAWRHKRIFCSCLDMVSSHDGSGGWLLETMGEKDESPLAWLGLALMSEKYLLWRGHCGFAGILLDLFLFCLVHFTFYN